MSQSPLALTEAFLLTSLSQSVYYVGGFGSEHFIGYIPLDKYQTANSTAETAAELGVAGRVLVTQAQD